MKTAGSGRTTICSQGKNPKRSKELKRLASSINYDARGKGGKRKGDPKRRGGILIPGK